MKEQKALCYLYRFKGTCTYCVQYFFEKRKNYQAFITVLFAFGIDDRIGQVSLKGYIRQCGQ